MMIIYRRYRSRRELVYIPEDMPWRLFTGVNSKFEAELRLAFGGQELVLADSELLRLDHKELSGADVCDCYDQVVRDAAEMLAREKPNVLNLEELLAEAEAEWEEYWEEREKEVQE